MRGGWKPVEERSVAGLGLALWGARKLHGVVSATGSSLPEPLGRGLVDVPPAVRPCDSGRTYVEMESSTSRGRARLLLRHLEAVDRDQAATDLNACGLDSIISSMPWKRSATWKKSPGERDVIGKNAKPGGPDRRADRQARGRRLGCGHALLSLLPAASRQSPAPPRPLQAAPCSASVVVSPRLPAEHFTGSVPAAAARKSVLDLSEMSTSCCRSAGVSPSAGAALPSTTRDEKLDS